MIGYVKLIMLCFGISSSITTLQFEPDGANIHHNMCNIVAIGSEELEQERHAVMQNYFQVMNAFFDVKVMTPEMHERKGIYITNTSLVNNEEKR